ncbi:MAG: hypothetical protein KF718_05715 [Polyangiaceae bacterium]|nr:hypothetical protein [Polyangiaceae bacterium]
MLPRSLLSRGTALGLAALLLAGGLAVVSCKKKNGQSAEAPAPRPTLRIAVVSTLAGALEPCGCQKDMLGGADHAAALLAKKRETAGAQLVLGAGPMFFMNPELDHKAATQEQWKADAIAESLSEMGLAAWSPGANDWAAGAARLAELRGKARATLLAANLSGEVAGATAVSVIEVAGHKVGVVGVSLPLIVGASPPGVKVEEAQAALVRGHEALAAQGARLFVALVSAPRGEALRLVETANVFHLAIIGKPFDRGEGNDAPTPPVLLGKTLVVQPPNHLQAVSVVDFFVRDGGFEFQDGIGIELGEKRQRLESRISELSARIADWEKQRGVSETDLDARRKELAAARAQLAGLAPAEPPKTGSYFRYELAEVRESVGTDAKVAGRMASYYKRVNEHNREAFKDRKPEPVTENQSSYLGAEACKSCHLEEHAFWKTTPHARAYVTLERQHKQFNLECVDCHVTGYEKPGGSTVTHVERLTDVQCEVCHGPGSRHLADPANPALILKTPGKDLCAPTCHHPPHVGPNWDVEQAWKKIIGPGHGG